MQIHLICCSNSMTHAHRYSDPDAERRDDFDGPPVEQRAERRFRQRFLKKGIASAALGNFDPPPAIEPEMANSAETGVVAIPDLTPTELDEGHVPLREALVNHFNHLWKKKKVQWLKYPNKRKPNF
jgi:hypothetical protein